MRLKKQLGCCWTSSNRCGKKVDSWTNIDQIPWLSDVFVKDAVTDYYHKRDYVELAAQKQYAERPSLTVRTHSEGRHFCWSVRARSTDRSTLSCSNRSIIQIRHFRKVCDNTQDKKEGIWGGLGVDGTRWFSDPVFLRSSKLENKRDICSSKLSVLPCFKRFMAYYLTYCLRI